ncbi:RagB/SusD family nutrient uptake outer membrane protein [Pedobacter panaciterrae]
MKIYKIFTEYFSKKYFTQNFYVKAGYSCLQKNSSNYFITLSFALILLLFVFNGCKKLVEVDGPITSVNSEVLFDNDQTATSVLTGLYAKMSSSNLQFENLLGISYLTGLSSDELTLYVAANNLNLNDYYKDNLNSRIIGKGFWGDFYQNLYTINSALEGVSNSKTLNPKVKKQLIGEALFMRAFYYFYLVNLYGDVPLQLTTDYKLNAGMSRIPKKEIWKQIILDLIEAQQELSEDYLDGTLAATTSERVRPTKFAATALLSRAYLYLKDWRNAEIEAGDLLENPKFKLVNLDEVFTANNKEAIWQLQGVKKGYNTQEAVAFIIIPGSGLNSTPVYLSQSLVNNFDQGDLRRNIWTNNISINGIDYFFAYKYKIGQSADLNAPINEYSTVLRLGEQYLIRAEARIQQNKIADGIADLNILRERATNKGADQNLQLKPLPLDLQQADALFAVEKERRTELFTEWGHRWLDLKRTGRIDAVMEQELPNKNPGGVWKSYQQLYPLELLQLQRNPKLVQNIGY